MECEHKNLNQQQFDEKAKLFETRKELYFFFNERFKFDNV